eukprot:CAMPEP_0174298558 /NCGR_PEP_ID=MMETSP0809-20121228/54154_1 /TAXON_ID=73025 ORGANISM="Eutreptiella gymnastica-like, Strain CCMP1594" /NCGR_SAMPLE_ID=MMETSP0809 /ASSEMBLY_ACC=CAM_ASM_000658 /LENGTH=83 /DNA_ID=CAMNT_0015403081 /DNA_START=487 /DNA_END=738 /DNA_ORIENTATION=-
MITGPTGRSGAASGVGAACATSASAREAKAAAPDPVPADSSEEPAPIDPGLLLISLLMTAPMLMVVQPLTPWVAGLGWDAVLG